MDTTPRDRGYFTAVSETGQGGQRVDLSKANQPTKKHVESHPEGFFPAITEKNSETAKEAD
ncbi:MAG: hypothetical protein WCX97_00065 [Candidatus Magasanikbacteria bacterium]